MKNNYFKTLVGLTSMINIGVVPISKAFDMFEEGSGSKFEAFQVLKAYIDGVSVEEFLSIYPLRKDYTSGKYGIKDYFSSMEFLKTFIASGNDILNMDNLTEFLMEVQLENRFFEMFMYLVAFPGLDEERAKMGQPSMSSMFFEYGVLENKKAIPNYLRVCK